MNDLRVQEIKAAVERELVTMHRLISTERAFGGYKYREAFKCTDLELASLEKNVRDTMTNKLAELGAIKNHLARRPFGRAIMRGAMRELDRAGRAVLEQQRKERPPIELAKVRQQEHIPFDRKQQTEKDPA